MKRRPVESTHKMDLRRSGPRRPTSKESLGYDEQDAATVDRDRGQRFHSNLDAETDDECNEGATVDLEENKEPCEVHSTVKLIRPPLLFCLVSTILVLFLFQVAFSEGDKEKQVAGCENAVKDLFEQYPQHESFWIAMNVSFKMCTKSDQPGVALVLHNGDGSIADCLVNHTASHLSRLIGASKSDEFYFVNGKNAHHIYDTNSFMTEIMDQRKGVLVFSNLEELDLKLVPNLHFICDIDPNIKDKSVIILLLKVQVQKFSQPELSDLARNKLGELWEEKLDDERFVPILGRITNNIGYIDENIPTKCP